MFSRDQAYNGETRPIPVLLTFDNGGEVHGSLNIPKLVELSEILSNGSPFLMFSFHDGQRAFVATSKIRSIQVLNVPNAKPLAPVKCGDFDPFEILGVARDDDHSMIRSAFHKLSKLYHPDKFAALEPPKEILDYLKVMSQRINLAYAAIEEKSSTKEHVA